MNKMKTVYDLLRRQVGLLAALVVLFGAHTALFAQTAEVRYAGVFYMDSPTNNNQMYCNYEDASANIKNFRLSGTLPSDYGDYTTKTPRDIGDVFQDGDYYVMLLTKDQETVPSGISSRTSYTNYVVGNKFYYSHYISSKYYYDIYIVNGYASKAAGYSIAIDKGDESNKSFVFSPTPKSSANTTDPWVSSALIEFDQPYPNSTPTSNKYPNHCLALCMTVTCNNKPLGGSTYSISFPLQNIKFDIVKYYNNKNVENPDETPAVRTIDLYPNTESAKCGSYRCPGSSSSGKTCGTAQYYTIGSDNGTCYSFADGSIANGKCTCSAENVCTYAVFTGDGIGSVGNESIPFCVAWDGTYEINGEFGSTNGQYAFRAAVATDSPGDSIIVDKIEFNSVIAYPGMNQIPMQVDLTNVHNVRSTPSVVGNITPVAAEPYTFVYRLSKDADVSVNIYDAATKDDDDYVSGTNASKEDGYLNDPSATATTTPALVRVLSDWEPHDGEGMNGAEKDTTLTTFDSWDGRNQEGLLLPAGNYLVSIQAKSQDEWGTDFSRAVTRQMSIDPLRLTDVVSTGLNKKATAYASISYVPTEAANVYWNIYTPGTTFDSIHTNSTTDTGTAPTLTNPTGSLVYSSIEARTSRMAFTSKWDGLCGIDEYSGKVSKDAYLPAGALQPNGEPYEDTKCQEEGGCEYKLKGCTRVYSKGEKLSDGTTCTKTAGCTEKFEYGAPMPDGNYVYALWAEIPYNGAYKNAAGTDGKPAFTAGGTCSESKDKECFTGVKTQKYTTGQVAIERGLVDITIQPVGYATVGSSPTAYGLDPFIFKYSIVRDANVIAKVTNTAGVTVKHLTPEEGITQVSQQMNTISWDGMDDTGRMVTPGTYMFVVETHDAMFPAVKNKASAVFPVDMYRVVDLSTTDVYGDSDAKATISYSLSKPMNVQVNIYNKDVVIPDYNSILNGDYSGFQVTSTATGVATTNNLSAGDPIIVGGTSMVMPTLSAPSATDVYAKQQTYDTNVRYTWTVMENPQYDETASTVPGKEHYRVSVLQENIVSTSGKQAWPPRVCSKNDLSVFTKAGTTSENCTASDECYVNPAKMTNANACIYVNDKNFTNYPKDADAVKKGEVDVRLQPVKTFERSSLKTGNGITIMEEWDALYFYNPNNCKAGSTVLSSCAYEMVPDGQYPFYISARSNEAFNRYYAHSSETIGGVLYPLEGTPVKASTHVVQESFLYATEKPVGKINVTRGAVYFLDGSTIVYPNIAQLFNASSNTIFIPPYEINFSVSRASTVEVAIVALADNVCNPVEGVSKDLKNNKAGDVCKYLSTMTINNIGSFDANTVRKMYWDGRDNNGYYVKSGVYEVRLIARNYPNPDLYEPTVKSITLNTNIMQVFDLLEADGYAISQRNTNMDIRYQISVPMKVAIQFFKPGTTIYDYQKGTLRNPTTGKEVKDIREVLVRSIVGIRPATTLINEQWDGLDYAQQEVPDGTYPFRFVTATESANIDTITGEIVAAGADDTSTNPRNWKINYVADTNEYTKLHNATIAIGDGTMVCSDWEKTVFFYPNPLKASAKGTLEITKMPAPGKVSIKFFNLAGDLVRDSNYTCVDANNYTVTMGKSLEFSPDNTPTNSVKMSETELQAFGNVRNAALRCRWDRTNQHGKKVARGVYFGLVDFKATSGRQHCQKVVKVLIP